MRKRRLVTAAGGFFARHRIRDARAWCVRDRALFNCGTATMGQAPPPLLAALQLGYDGRVGKLFPLLEIPDSERSRWWSAGNSHH